MIWIVAGTSEGRELIGRVKDLDNFIGTTATDSGKQFISSENIISGRMNKAEMMEFTKKYNIDLIVDLTHPYAKIVSQNLREVSKDLNISYIRYVREKTKHNSSCIYLNSYEECYEFLKDINSTVFFTTGSKNIGDFEKIRGNNRFIYRVLPALESIEECRRYNIKLQDIIGVLGPFSKEYNKIMFREYLPQYVIMKDSGEKGGTLEKIQACEELGIKAVIIGRDEENGFSNLDDIEKLIREKYKRR